MKQAIIVTLLLAGYFGTLYLVGQNAAHEDAQEARQEQNALKYGWGKP